MKSKLYASILLVSLWFWNLSPTPPPPEIPLQEYIHVEEAIQQAISDHRENALAYLVYDTKVENLNISRDGNWATAWLIPTDPDTGQIIPSEPGLAIGQKVDKAWQIYLPGDLGWETSLPSLSEDVLSDAQKSYLLLINTEAQAQVQSVLGPLRGYLLPWEAGKTLRLSRSLAHDEDFPSGNAHYSFDFYEPSSFSITGPNRPAGLMFNIYASRSGTVWKYEDRYPNGNVDYPNYIVLEDTSTNPTTYQLYLHLAFDSIPKELKTIGAPVQRGQLIGIADDTGASSGHHLHFQVQTPLYTYWGKSLDIVFEDVDINGGRPRVSADSKICYYDGDEFEDICDVFRSTYTSQNVPEGDRTPPFGDIFEPLHGSIILTDTIHLEGWAQDADSGLRSAQFTAFYDSAWHKIGPTFTDGMFAYDWDVCADDVPDGPVSLSLDLRDEANNLNPNLPGLRHLSKNFTCPAPPPSCVPDDGQVAIFENPDYHGNCVLLDAGDYPNPIDLEALGEDTASSIQVGANVWATLYMDVSLAGRAETFTTDDSNLADNRIGVNTLSSIKIKSRSTSPNTPKLIWPEDGEVLPNVSSLSLAWYEAGGGMEYQVNLTFHNNQSRLPDEIRTSAWLSEPVWHLGSLTPGSYSWQVKARNSSGQGAYSATIDFQIDNQPAPPADDPITAPFTDTMEATETLWTGSSSWKRTELDNHTPGGASSWTYDPQGAGNYDTGAPNAGYLTSPLIHLPADKAYFLRFWYKYETEGSGKNWDQRWVQLSINGGPFTNIVQLAEDASNFWLQSPAISLAEHAGKDIQVRFHFETLDSVRNENKGWFIDDFTISSLSPDDCSDSDNEPEQATLIDYGDKLIGTICPAGDMDYFKFSGQVGDQIGAATFAQIDGSPLDTFLFLLDSDGKSVLASNDDHVQAQLTDSFLSYRLPRTGDYYLKLRAWDHPGAGSEKHTYRVQLIKDSNAPSASLTYPNEYDGLPEATITVTVMASDPGSGISHVRFLQHNADWKSGDWELLGEDWDGENGWSFVYDNVKEPMAPGGAFYAIAYDWAGNSYGVGVWHINSATIFLYLPMIHK